VARFLLLCLLVACATPLPIGVEAVALDGRHLKRPHLADAERVKRERQLGEARALQDDLERSIWIGRRLGYLHRYREAIDVFTAAIDKHPRDARLYRFRGHRYLTVRKFDAAIRDLRRASELIRGTADTVEPDGMPNAANTPTSTLHGNIWYHLGLAYYYKADWRNALAALRRSFAIATNDDMKVAAGYWVYLLELRIDRARADETLANELPEAAVLLENHAYWALIQMFRKKITPDEVRAQNLDDATIGYGIAQFHFLNGDQKTGFVELRRVVGSDAWPSFGFIAAEAALKRH
jgi:tetratricopeptide (TPR) repeat protein